MFGPARVAKKIPARVKVCKAMIDLRRATSAIEILAPTRKV
jgi:hypothetical protein